jgi:Reverse transcriptase (RNA-dependent DNA polymerase)
MFPISRSLEACMLTVIPALSWPHCISGSVPHCIASALTDIGFRVSKANPGIFCLHWEREMLILAVHVDDCMLTGSSSKLIADYKLKIHSQYLLINLVPTHWLLGIKIDWDRFTQTISLSQESYLNTIIA